MVVTLQMQDTPISNIHVHISNIHVHKLLLLLKFPSIICLSFERGGVVLVPVGIVFGMIV